MVTTAAKYSNMAMKLHHDLMSVNHFEHIFFLSMLYACSERTQGYLLNSLIRQKILGWRQFQT